MKEKPIVASVVALLVAGVVLALLGARIIWALGNTDVIYVVISIAFFGLCIAYAEGCEKL